MKLNQWIQEWLEYYIRPMSNPADDFSDVSIDFTTYEQKKAYLIDTEYHDCPLAILPKGTYYVHLLITGWFTKGVSGKAIVKTPKDGVEIGVPIAISSETGNPVWYKMTVSKTTDATVKISYLDESTDWSLSAGVFTLDNLTTPILKNNNT